MERAYRVGGTAVVWFALALQYYLIVRYETDGDLAAATVRFFGFFTILTNILVALAFTLPWLAPRCRIARFFVEPSVRTAILVYIIVVAMIYHTLLAGLWNPQGLQLVADTIEHIVTPLLYVIDWLLFVPKGTLQFRSVPAWLGFPFLYAGYSLGRGAATGFYPYPFLDVATLRYEGVLFNMAGLVVMFAALGIALVALDRWLARARQEP